MCFIRRHCITLIVGVEELTPKVRSLHVRMKANAISFQVLNGLIAHEISPGEELPSRLPSRIINMPSVLMMR
jgi:uncharacterized protein YqhQ